MSGPLIKVRGTHQVRIEVDGTDVVFILDGRKVFQAHHRFAEQVGKALIENAIRARMADPLRLDSAGRRP